MGIDSKTLRVPGILDLAQHGIRVVIPDLRGHGASAPGAEADYCHAVWAHDIRTLAEQLRLSRFALLGHSYGGFLALEYAVRWPETLTHLVLVSTSAGPLSIPATALPDDAAVRAHFRAIWPHLFAGPTKHWDLFDTLRFSAGPYNAAFLQALPAYDLRDRVCALTMPILLVVGEQDAYRPHMEWLAHHLPHAIMAVLPAVGHFPFIEARARFVELVSAFLGRDRSGRVDAPDSPPTSAD